MPVRWKSAVEASVKSFSVPSRMVWSKEASCRGRWWEKTRAARRRTWASSWDRSVWAAGAEDREEKSYR